MIDNIKTENFIKFVMPSILVMVFISIYTAVDGLFIAKIVGPEALAGLNISMPIFSIAFACGIMLATGGGAVIAVKLGKGEIKEAGENLTTLLLFGSLFGVAAGSVCLLFKEEMIHALGASKAISPYALSYGTFLIISFPFLIMKVLFESMLRVDGKPEKALYMTLMGGITNLILDYLFMVPFQMGIAGAGLGTLLGIILSLYIGFRHFSSSGTRMRFKVVKPDLNFLSKTIGNGSSEMVNEAALAVTTIVFNILAMRYMGDTGVAAIAVLMALNFLSISLMIGFSSGVAPLISYNYGRGNKENLQKILQYSLLFIAITSVVFFILNLVAAQWLVSLYLDNSNLAYKLAVDGLKIFSISYLFSGINIFGTAFFTAFENGKTSALISFFKSFIIFMIAALILPRIYGSTGIWLITPLTEFCAMIMVISYMKRYQGRYSYNLIRAVPLLNL